MTSFAHRLKRIRERVQAACDATDRDPSSVRILGASKSVSADRIKEALAAGQRLLGESRAQSLRDKARLLDAHDPAPEWHFIGHLQRNKIKYLVDRVNTTSTAFLGLTMECAQCHDHKFDPMTQREYYEFAGFFNSLEGRGNTKGATSPTCLLYTSPSPRD